MRNKVVVPFVLVNTTWLRSDISATLRAMVKQNLATVRETVSRVARRCGRDPESIRIVAVTKTHPRDLIDELRAAGVRVFGENRVQEAAAKFGDIADEVELHLVGHLQKNKAKQIPGLCTHVDSVDTLELAAELSRRCVAAGRRCNILLQFNSSGEPTKSGYTREDDLLSESTQIASLPRLSLRGVMTIGPFTPDATLVREAFARTRRVFDRLREILPDQQIDTLSMGMSDDYEIAIEEGSTELRLGTALFGARGSGGGG